MNTQSKTPTPVSIDKEVLEITPGEWFSSGLDIRTENWHILNLNPYSPESSNRQANATAICTAVNNTYGIGIDPTDIPKLKEENEKLKQANKFLLDTLSLIKSEGGFGIDSQIGKRINTAFNKSKL